MSLIPCKEPGCGCETTDALLGEVAKRFGGYIPNFHKVLANSPPVLEGFIRLHGALGKSSLSALDREVVALEVSRRNECGYCTAAHSMAAKKQGLPAGDLAKLLSGERVLVPQQALVQQATRDILDNQGRLGKTQMALYEQAGLSQAMLMEIVATIGLFTLATLANNMAETPVDTMFL